jgi:hypothetical protein
VIINWEWLNKPTSQFKSYKNRARAIVQAGRVPAYQMWGSTTVMPKKSYKDKKKI